MGYLPNHQQKTGTITQNCPTIYKSNPGKSIPLEMTTIHLNLSKTNLFQQQNNMFSLRLIALILHDSLHGESRICCLSHHWEMATVTKRTTQQQTSNQSKANKKLKQALQSIQDEERNLSSDWNWSPTPIHPGYRVHSRNTNQIPKKYMKTAFRKRLVFPRHNPRQSSCVALHRTQPFATAFANGEKESTTLASEPRVSDVLAILKPQWKLFQSPAATQPVDCKNYLTIQSIPSRVQVFRTHSAAQ